MRRRGSSVGRGRCVVFVIVREVVREGNTARHAGLCLQFVGKGKNDERQKDTEGSTERQRKCEVNTVREMLDKEYCRAMKRKTLEHVVPAGVRRESTIPRQHHQARGSTMWVVLRCQQCSHRAQIDL